GPVQSQSHPVPETPADKDTRQKTSSFIGHRIAHNNGKVRKQIAYKGIVQPECISVSYHNKDSETFFFFPFLTSVIARDKHFIEKHGISVLLVTNESHLFNATAGYLHDVYRKGSI
ncbi:unnamed protein product, partial [Ixodes persulcatus]